MERRTVRLAGPGTLGSHVHARVLGETTELLVQGTQRALRLRTQGRSSARGLLPPWIEAASDVVLSVGGSMERLSGPTLLHIELPTLLQVAPSVFGQMEMFPELDVSRTSFDYLVDSMSAAVNPAGDDALYDGPFLEFLRKQSSIFDAGVDTMAFVDGAGRSRTLLELTIGSLQGLQSLEETIPPPQRMRIAGLLDTIRASDLSFVLVLKDGSKVRGVADSASSLKEHWKTPVVVSGRGFYTSKQRIQRIEADRIVPATERDLDVWGIAPMAGISIPHLRRPQRPRSGLAAVINRWPGDESDEEIARALRELS